MTKRIYRRFLLAAIMLLMATSLTYIGPSARAQGPTQGLPNGCWFCYCDGGICSCVRQKCP
jgi:hypothetical protein